MLTTGSITTEMLSRYFELFAEVDHSLDHSQGGLGLGLTLVRSLVEMHGGSVQAVSEGLNRGSELIVRLPIVEPDRLSVDVRDCGGARCTRGGPMKSVRAHLWAGCSWWTIMSRPCKSLAMVLKLDGHDVEVTHDGGQARSTRSGGFAPKWFSWTSGCQALTVTKLRDGSARNATWLRHRPAGCRNRLRRRRSTAPVLVRPASIITSSNPSTPMACSHSWPRSNGASLGCDTCLIKRFLVFSGGLCGDCTGLSAGTIASEAEGGRRPLNRGQRTGAGRPPIPRGSAADARPRRVASEAMLFASCGSTREIDEHWTDNWFPRSTYRSCPRHPRAASTGRNVRPSPCPTASARPREVNGSVLECISETRLSTVKLGSGSVAPQNSAIVGSQSQP